VSPCLCGKFICLTVCRSDSEFELEAKLHDAGSADSVGDHTEVGAWIADDIVRSIEVDVVEEIENLPAKLQPEAFGEVGVLREAEVETVLPRATQDVATQIAESKIIRITACHAERRAESRLVEVGVGSIRSLLPQLIERAAQTGPTEGQSIEPSRAEPEAVVLRATGHCRFCRVDREWGSRLGLKETG
jgi:hypothetical protein